MANMTTRTSKIFHRTFGVCCSFFIATQSWGAEANGSVNAVPSLVRDMAGVWNVEEWMWPGPGAEAVSLPPAVARRELIGNDFVQEIMSTPANSREPFTRASYFGYNAVERRYEYFSLDTRAPQMMNERSDNTDGERSGSGVINLPGGTFVASQWGAARDVAFRYRLLVGRIEDNRQIVELYLTPLSASSPQEFLAFRYLYTRQP